MITSTQQIVWSIVSRQPIADLSATNRQPVADQSQPISNQFAIDRPLVADRSPTGRRCLGVVVADQSPIDLQPKNAVFDRTVVALVAAVFSRKAVANRLQYMCDRGFRYVTFFHFGWQKSDSAALCAKLQIGWTIETDVMDAHPLITQIWY